MPKAVPTKARSFPDNDSVETAISKKSKKKDQSQAVAKFGRVASAFFENVENNVADWIIGNGFEDTSASSKKIPTKYRGWFAEEMRVLFDDYAYDTLVRTSQEEDGMVAITSKRRNEDNKNMSVFSEIKAGPSTYVPLCSSELRHEGAYEAEEKSKVRESRRHKDVEAKRAMALGGAIYATPEAKDLLAYLLGLRRAHVIQRSTIALRAEGTRSTLKKKHVDWAIQTEGTLPV